MFKVSIAVLMICSFLGLLVSPALAATGDEVLAKVEHAMNGAKDRKAEIKMTIKTKDGTTKERRMKIFQKGTQKKLFTFLAP
ncbi:MAG: hypothetical protein JRF33_14715, partial [Deltaproteobacteria bacterium]|nr:hypothetical protein [Deltaproteobacteria bacterium]